MYSSTFKVMNGIVKETKIKEYNESEYKVEGGGGSSSFCWYK